MTIFMNKIRYPFLLGLPILFWVLVAFQLPPMPVPDIKKKVYKKYTLTDQQEQLKQHTVTQYNIHGEIIEYAVYDPTSNQLQELRLLKYNPLGLLVGTMVYDQNKALVWSQEHKYNGSDQIIKRIETDYTTASPQKSYTTLSYDKSGRLVETKTYNHKNIQITETTKSYSATGELVSLQDWSLNKAGERSSKKTISIENQYNQSGQLIHSIRQEHQGKIKTKDIKTFENSAIVSWTKFENGRLISQFKHKQKELLDTTPQYLIPPPMQDPENNLLEYDDDKRDPLQNIAHTAYRTITEKLNKQGLPTKQVAREYNQIVAVTYYTYNSQNKLIKERILDKITDKTTTMQYTYDLYQNITQKLTYKSDTLIQKLDYSYEYYYQ